MKHPKKTERKRKREDSDQEIKDNKKEHPNKKRKIDLELPPLHPGEQKHYVRSMSRYDTKWSSAKRDNYDSLPKHSPWSKETVEKTFKKKQRKGLSLVHTGGVYQPHDRVKAVNGKMLKTNRKLKPKKSKKLYNPIDIKIEAARRICKFMFSHLQELKNIQVVYRYGYPCLMVRPIGPDSYHWTKGWTMYAMYIYIGIVNRLLAESNINNPMKLIKRSSFGHIEPSIADCNDYFRINPGDITQSYYTVLIKCLEILDHKIEAHNTSKNRTDLSNHLSVKDTKRNMMYEFTRTYEAQQLIISLAYKHKDRTDLLSFVAIEMNRYFVLSKNKKKTATFDQRSAKPQLEKFSNLKSLSNRKLPVEIPDSDDELDFGSDSEDECEAGNNINIYCKKITVASGMNAIMTLHDKNLDKYLASPTKRVGHMYYEYKDLVELTGKRRAIIDLNPCVNDKKWGMGKLKTIPINILNQAEIFDITSSTTAEIAQILKLRVLKTTVFVRSGTKHGSKGLDINAFGEIRIFTYNRKTLTEMVNIILDSEYAVPVGQKSHQIRRYFLNNSGGLTNSAILKMFKDNKESDLNYSALELTTQAMMERIDLIHGKDQKTIDLRKRLKYMVFLITTRLKDNDGDKKALHQLRQLKESLGLTSSSSKDFQKRGVSGYSYNDYMPRPSNETNLLHENLKIIDVPGYENNCLIHAIIRSINRTVSDKDLINFGVAIRKKLVEENRTLPGELLYMYYHGRRILEIIHENYCQKLNPDNYTIMEHWTHGDQLQPSDRVGNGNIIIDLWNSGNHYQVIVQKDSVN